MITKMIKKMRLAFFGKPFEADYVTAMMRRVVAPIVEAVFNDDANLEDAKADSARILKRESLALRQRLHAGL